MSDLTGATFARRPTGVSHPKLEEHIVDFEALEAVDDLIRGDVLFSALGTTRRQAGSKAAQYRVDYHYQLSDLAPPGRAERRAGLCVGVLGRRLGQVAILLYADEGRIGARRGEPAVPAHPYSEAGLSRWRPGPSSSRSWPSDWRR